MNSSYKDVVEWDLMVLEEILCIVDSREIKVIEWN
jgi:hypothetical protein